MSNDVQYQLRLYFSEAARADAGRTGILAQVLVRHGATLKCQFDAFADYVAEAERDGVEHFPLYRWTKATLEDAAKSAKHLSAFAVRIGGQEVYDEAVADALEAELRPLVDGVAITRLSRHDTDPANNMPVPAEFRG